LCIFGLASAEALPYRAAKPLVSPTKSMIFPLFRRPARPDTISVLYGTIVAQARLPCFYQDYAVADTVNGRFDLIVLHLSLVLDRLSTEPSLHDLWQGLFDRFCRDMDHNLREMGISDLKVPKEMRRIGEAFYGRAQAYRTALANAEGTALEEALVRNVYDGRPAGQDAALRLSAYMRGTVEHLAGQDAGALAAGVLHFPDPRNYLRVVE
jgi:cytochrome b pre-mRNA-processing protein 3